MVMNVWCNPRITKQADEMAHAYSVNVYVKLTGSHKILSDNGIGFINAFFAKVSSILAAKQFSVLPYPRGDGCTLFENMYQKTCVRLTCLGQNSTHSMCCILACPKQTFQIQCIFPHVWKRCNILH